MRAAKVMNNGDALRHSVIESTTSHDATSKHQVYTVMVDIAVSLLIAIYGGWACTPYIFECWQCKFISFNIVLPIFTSVNIVIQLHSFRKVLTHVFETVRN